MKDQIVLQSPLKQIPEEALCDLCKNLNIKPYILTCCSRSIWKIWKVTTFDINQAPTCIFWNTNKFKIEPNIQGYLCIKSIFDLKEVQPLKNDEESINKVLIWKELNSIYFSKLKQINSENLIKEQDRNMFLMKWLKQFISSSFYVLKFSNVKEKFETSNEIVCTYPQPVVENKDQTKQEEKPSPPQVKFKLTKNLFSINKNLDEAEPLFTDESSRQFLIITEESQKLYGVVSLGKETRKDSKKDKDGDKNDKLRSFKCNWKVVWDLSQDLDFIEDFTKASPKQAINLIISMLKDEIEENKQNCENPGDGFYKYAVSNLIDSNSWISTIVSSVGKLRTSGRSDNRGAYDERSEAGQGSSELTLQKKASKNEETSFYEDIQMKSKPSSSKDAKGENKSGKKSKYPKILTSIGSNKNESKGKLDQPILKSINHIDRVNDRDSDSYSDNKRSSYNNRNKGKKRRRSRDSRSRSNERRSRERRRSRDRKDKDDRKRKPFQLLLDGRDSNYKRENEKKRDERSPRRDRQANRDSKERQRNKDQKDKRRERDRGSDEQNSKPNKNKTDGRSDRSKSRDNGRENKDNKDNKDSKDNKDNKDSKESPRRDRRSNERKRDKKEERKANNE